MELMPKTFDKFKKRCLNEWKKSVGKEGETIEEKQERAFEVLLNSIDGQ